MLQKQSGVHNRAVSGILPAHVCTLFVQPGVHMLLIASCDLSFVYLQDKFIFYRIKANCKIHAWFGTVITLVSAIMDLHFAVIT